MAITNPTSADRHLHRRRGPDLQLPPDGEEHRRSVGLGHTTVVDHCRRRRHASCSSAPTRPAIQPGQSLDSDVGGAERHQRDISPGPGSVNAHSGSTSVTPATTTTYTLTATGAGGTVNAERHGDGRRDYGRQPADHPVRGQPAQHRSGRTVHFELDHQRRHHGDHQPSVGNVTANGSTTVTPTATTTYTLTATSSDGKSVSPRRSPSRWRPRTSRRS